MGFRTLKMQPITFNANGVFPVNINQAGNLCELGLNIAGSLTVGTPATNNVRANIGRGDIWSCISRLDIIGNGQEVLQTYTGPQLVETARRDMGVNPKQNPKLGDGINGTVPFDEYLPLSIWTPQAKRAIDTALQTDRFQSVRAQVTWGDATSICSAGASFGTNPTLNLSGLYNIDPFIPPYLKKVFRTTVSPTGSQTNVRMDLPIGPAYHRLLINVTSSGSDDSTKLNNVRLISGSTIFADVDDVTLRERGCMSSEIPNTYDEYTPVTDTFGVQNVAIVDATAAFSQTITNNNTRALADSLVNVQRRSRSSKSNLLAWYDLNLAPDGQLEQSIPTVQGGRALAEFFLEFDVSGACTIDVFSQTISANPFAGNQG
jgi:hypothetical protein